MIHSSYVYICAFALIAMFGGALLGLFAARSLPSHHLDPQSSAVVKLSAAVVASLTSLVLALMLSSAHNTFAANAGIVKKLGSDFIQLDHTLRAYGPDADAARTKLRAYAGHKYDELFPLAPPPSPIDPRETADLLDGLLDAILSLSLPDRRHTALSVQALALTNNIYAERWLLWENPGTTVPVQFLFVLIFWLFLLFVSFGLFSPTNLTVVVSFFLSSVAVTGAVLLTLELGHPMHRQGWLQVSGEPLQRALLEIGRP